MPKYVVLSPRGVQRDIVRRMALPAKISRRQPNKTEPAADNGVFDNRVLSRQHAEIFEAEGKVWLKDLNSSNGTYLNNAGPLTDPVELNDGDIVDFGVDVHDDSSTQVIHHKLTVQVSFPVVYRNGEVAETLPEIEENSFAPAHLDSGAPSLEKVVALLQGELLKQQAQRSQLTYLANALTKKAPASNDDAEPQDIADQACGPEAELQEAREKRRQLEDVQRELQAVQAERDLLLAADTELKNKRQEAAAARADAAHETLQQQQCAQSKLDEALRALRDQLAATEAATAERLRVQQDEYEELLRQAGGTKAHETLVADLQARIEAYESKQHEWQRSASAQEHEGTIRQLLEQLAQSHVELRAARKQLGDAVTEAAQMQSRLQAVRDEASRAEAAAATASEELGKLRRQLAEQSAWALWSPRSIALVIFLVVVGKLLL